MQIYFSYFLGIEIGVVPCTEKSKEGGFKCKHNSLFEKKTNCKKWIDNTVS